ncbi:MAG: SDR family NAD(P)-dependent oxidoreductase [Spirochaetes bacterium]|nr:SDR family NAD(P)-dependent oxidoreductase [Spirochaetota bacterium]
MKKFYHGKTVYITGGSSGIGLECAKLCASFGAHVVIIARDQNKLESACKEISRFRKNDAQRISWASLDVTGAAEVERNIPLIVGKHGSPEILIACAGESYSDYFENIGFEKFDAIMKVNVYGLRNIIFALLPYMKNKSSHISIVSSLAGLVGVFGYTAYGTSKFAAVGFAECLRPELKRYGITISVVCPPEVDTPLLRKELVSAPREGQAVKKFAGFLTPQFVAKVMLKKIAQKSFLIIPGFRAKMTYFFHRHSNGRISRIVSDLIIKIRAKNSKL